MAVQEAVRELSFRVPPCGTRNLARHNTINYQDFSLRYAPFEMTKENCRTDSQYRSMRFSLKNLPFYFLCILLKIIIIGGKGHPVPSNKIIKRKILIIRPSALGDTLMLLPAFVQLRPLTEITLVGRTPALELLRAHVQAGIDYEGPGWHRLFMEKGDLSESLPVPPVDQAVTFMKDPDGRVEKNLRGFLPNRSIHMFAPFPPEGEMKHVALYLAQCLQGSGLPLDAKKAIEYADRQPLFCEKVQSDIKERIIFHPGSGGRKKNHSPEFWLELIKAMRNHHLFEKTMFLLLLGPAEEPSYSFFKENAAGERMQILLSPDTQILVRTIRESCLFIGQDSGITHLAAMHGTPTLALFKGSNVHQWKPLGPSVKVIEDKMSRPDLIEQTLNSADALMKDDEQHRIQESEFRSQKRTG
jgi:heptosyltransferase-3